MKCKDKEEKITKKIDKKGRKKLIITRSRECVSPPANE